MLGSSVEIGSAETGVRTGHRDRPRERPVRRRSRHALRGGAAGTLGAVGAFVALAIVFGVTDERTRNLAVRMVVHGLYDATIFPVGYAALA
ncbi:hypothetical protein ATJ93_3279 [Halopiger aswanensis]|uniref:Uncharacterized protein n=1 Tax=Halopiger aswanensis TaxID=148449 RepID=A0A419WDU1_9EURY|nr:hypothetical protein ATJ93_3279 [Halopiger aswanensis]